MPIHSMTGFAQVRGQITEHLGCALSLKSVNHRHLDVQVRMPPDTDLLEAKLRRILRERLYRGHVELTISLERSGELAMVLNRQLVGSYIKAFRAASEEFGLTADPDLNAVLRLPGALEASSSTDPEEMEAAVSPMLEQAIERLNAMRREEGRGIDRELRERMALLSSAASEVERYRGAILHTYHEKLQSRMKELMGSQVDGDRLLQEAALMADRSDIREEVVRMKTHVDHFLKLLDAGGEAGKKLDFLLQEMGREANTLLSKTSGVAGEALRITGLGLAMKAEIEKAREQVQNIE
ncbi:MAG TPA: YicC/YloC family endoribonuclease [Terriglobales bacterium]|nr:YicC/YloC family endoribonuclease [Terriglobales bacterium]